MPERQLRHGLAELDTGVVRLRGKDPDNPVREIDIEWSAADFTVLAPQIAAALRP